ncbi:MAG TPA: acyltransferase, partial [Succinivibrio sp.]|nr:acyltransferase [Succinivibrio sp.]
SDSDNQKLLKNILSFIGLVLIVVGLISIKSNGVYPGKKALIPVFGAIFIIAAGKDSFINRKLLSNKVMVFLGLISYPLY